MAAISSIEVPSKPLSANSVRPTSMQLLAALRAGHPRPAAARLVGGRVGARSGTGCVVTGSSVRGVG